MAQCVILQKTCHHTQKTRDLETYTFFYTSLNEACRQRLEQLGIKEFGGQKVMGDQEETYAIVSIPLHLRAASTRYI